VQGPDGSEKLIWMGSYGIGVGRLLASIAELHHDDAGLVWPVSVAPYPVHLVALAGGEEAAEALDATLRGSNLEPLFDDRAESAGVKFADADLVGLPLRLTVSRRSLQRGGAELKERREGEGVIVGLEEAAGRVREAVDRLHAEIRRGVVVMPYRA
jgi:prolyl-tRNA synthetase